jgi:dihydroneopterin aldolase
MNGEVERPRGRSRTDRILIRDLVLPCRIGAYARERHGTQRVRFNVALAVPAAARPAGDALSEVVSYAEVADGIRALAAGPHVNLVETLAERVAALCLAADPRIAAARVRVEKLEVEPDSAGVGVEIVRRRDRNVAAMPAPAAPSRDATAARLAAELPRWSVEDTAGGPVLARSYRTGGWKATMMVANAIAHLAESAWHHPDLALSYPSVTVRLTTHDAGGITDKDFALAARIEALLGEADPATPPAQRLLRPDPE